jgi:transposase
MNKTIYPSRSQVANNVFSIITDLRKLLIVPVDFAKKEYTVQFCLGSGDFLLKRPLTIYNNLTGFNFLIKKIKGICSKYHIPASNVLIGGEDPDSYTRNFIYSLHSHYKFVSVRAVECIKFRTNTRVSSDILDLNGIAQAIINRRSLDFDMHNQHYSNLKVSSRARDRMVRNETAQKNRIHKTVDILFPGFLSEKATGLTPFAPASLALMENDFSVMKIKRMRTDTLVRFLKKHRAQKAPVVAEKLKTLAINALPPAPDAVEYYKATLRTKVEYFKAIRKSISQEENEMARLLVRTPGFYLTSIPGIGAVLAGGLVGEIMSNNQWQTTDHVASYGGIVPREKQTGGSDSLPIKKRLPYDANRKLKNWLLQGAYHVGTTMHPAGRYDSELALHSLVTHYKAVENRDGKTLLSTAKKMLKIMKRLFMEERIYLPETWLDQQTDITSEETIAYYEVMGNSLKSKWKGYNLSGITDGNSFYHQWTEQAQALKKIAIENIK